ncbi:phenylalanine--tRNA ligase subunit beta [Patescibacteria group bacterium]|nr:phenylalanine--tRNA ligase subunit beta [Patescibacteria group bacterium]MBU0777082.1 phenylalanine--tRNA ligase subunit beta [Patescibacteria group bacterium]MBU0845776.1 phenylalanine--tRNA ligase subunit beta [Patescibacteria group bacterium]MBU0922803.1 phenylalanine--tRNA ligase subunit beta [Patescibacteria group bacterium]MBU1066464.1 phenylalanine--tRNA ligase subunit beta [Patescibacteria group bacterium]
MDIIVSDNWLKDYLKTTASPKALARSLSLSGPSVDKIERGSGDFLYHIEITTNRVDTAGIYGIAREAAAILPRFKIQAKLLPLRTKSKQSFARKVKYLDVKIDPKLCLRFAAVLIKNVKIKPSPDYIKERLMAVGERPINNIVDISNYIMHEIGQPVHTFDYDKIRGSKMILRASKKGEKLTTLDGKTHQLPGGDIVIEDGEGRLIDLAGIMGGQNSAVDSSTKNVLLFVQTYNPVNIRKTYMNLAQRTEAAVLFEKGLDTELVGLGIKRGIDLFVKLTGGKPENTVLDIYPKPYKARRVITTLTFFEKRLGIKLSKSEISKYLNLLGFETSWNGKKLETLVPSFRANDIFLAEDILEEVARLYGYHNLPSSLMTGAIPDPLVDAPFDFEDNIKNLLSGWGGVEAYTLSTVPESSVETGALKLKNPLGKESSFMRTSLMPSLIKALKENTGEKEPFHLFEIANAYLPRKNMLPDEKMILAGIFANTNYREAKGIIEALLEKLNADVKFVVEDGKVFSASKRSIIKSNNVKIGQLGVLEESSIYYEFDLGLLKKISLAITPYTTIPKYPAQIEDMTLVLPSKTRIGEVAAFIESAHKNLVKVELVTIYKDSHTFRLWYQHPEKTLNNKDVEIIRNKVVSGLREKFGARTKD